MLVHAACPSPGSGPSQAVREAPIDDRFGFPQYVSDDVLHAVDIVDEALDLACPPNNAPRGGGGQISPAEPAGTLIERTCRALDGAVENVKVSRRPVTRADVRLPLLLHEFRQHGRQLGHEDHDEQK